MIAVHFLVLRTLDGGQLIPLSFVENKSVYDLRKNMGAELAKEFLKRRKEFCRERAWTI